METRRQRYQSKRSKSNRFLIVTISIMLIAFLVTFTIGYIKLMPNKDQLETSTLQTNPIFINHHMTDYSAIVDNDVVKLPLTFLNEILTEDPIYYEPATQTIVLTTSNQVMRYKTESLEALLNEKEVSLMIKTEVIDEEVYIPAQLMYEWYHIQVDALESGVVHVYDKEQTVQFAKVSEEKGTFLRESDHIKSPFYFRLDYNSSLYILDKVQESEWYLVQTVDGYNGYVNAKHITLTDTINWSPDTNNEVAFIPPSLDGKKINLTWEAIYNSQPNLAKMPSLEGVNVVSPTWFELINEKGTIQGKATHEYMKWAHNKGFHVWPLFSNGFDPDWTTEVLGSVDTRFKMIEQIVLFAQTYKFEGINIDFENVYTKDKENLVQFVRELTPIMHDMDIVVSIDVTPKSDSEMWSKFIDRRALGQVVDYMMVMAYDEHWAASPIAGSVGSIPWVERSIKRILDEDEVPSSKLILGIPLYTRVWTEVTQADGSIKVSSKAIGMEKAEQIIADKKLTKVYLEDIGQHYVEYDADGGKQRIWLEDEKSLQNRIELVHKYQLGGIATWSRSFQKPSIWAVMNEALNP